MKFPYRNHISQKKLSSIDLDYDYSKDDSAIKPDGFWYGIKDEWYTFLQEEMDIKPLYIYKVYLKSGKLTTIDRPDKDKILRIKTVEDAILFIKQYVKTLDKDKFTYDWRKLKRSFGGIEIHNPGLLKEEVPNIVITSWDVSSGCIWNMDIIMRITLIKN